MNVIIIQDATGRIESVHRTVSGAAHALAGHGTVVGIGGQDAFGIDALEDALAGGRVVVAYADQTELGVERHFAAV